MFTELSIVLANILIKVFKFFVVVVEIHSLDSVCSLTYISMLFMDLSTPKV